MIHNRYHTIYFNLIHQVRQEGRSRKNGTYYEKHHIIPKSMGGTDDPNNLVFLTAKEHIFAHHLLCKFTEGEQKKSCLRAFHSMCFQNNGGKNKRYPSLRQLALAREYASRANKGKRGITGPPVWSGAETLTEWKNMLVSFVESGMSDPKIGERYSVSATAIHIWRKKLNIQKRRPNLNSKEWLYDQYITNKKSAADIAKEVGCTGTAVQQKLHHYRIPIRSALERQRNRKERKV